MRVTGVVPDDSSFRGYIAIASDEELELAAKGACEAVVGFQSVELDYFRRDLEATAEAEEYLDNWIDELFARNEILLDDQETIGNLVLWEPFVESACPELLGDA